MNKTQIKNLVFEFIGEFFGAFIFVFLSLHSIYYHKNKIIRALLVGGSLAIGLLFANRFSKGHLNPIKTTILYHAQKITFREFLIYLLYQIMGGLLALYVFAKYDAGKKLSELQL